MFQICLCPLFSIALDHNAPVLGNLVLSAQNAFVELTMPWIVHGVGSAQAVTFVIRRQGCETVQIHHFGCSIGVTELAWRIVRGGQGGIP